MEKTIEITKEELKTLQGQARELAEAIGKNIGEKFSVYTLRDAMKSTHEEAQETLFFLDNSGFLRKEKSKFQLLLDNNIRFDFLSKRNAFLRAEAKRFLDAANYYDKILSILEEEKGSTEEKEN